MPTMRSILVLGCLVLAACTPDDLIRDPRLDRWCGDRLCQWDVEGEIDRIGTWHAKDYAVRFTSDDARISQLNDTVSDLEAHCFHFTMLAKVDPDAKLFLELDFFDDGKIDLQQRIPAGNWDFREFFITPPTWYEGVRFILRKDGPGYAALAQLTANESEACTKAPIDLGPRPAGARCEVDKQCAVGTCGEADHDDWCWSDEPCFDKGTCGGCRNDDDCGDAGLCAPTPRGGDSARECTTPGSVEFGEPCERGEECATGVCCQGTCSTCCFDSCDGGRACGHAVVEGVDASAPTAEGEWPMLCAPGEGAGQKGDVCTGDTDCESGRCSGGSAECFDLCSEPGEAPCISCERVRGGSCD